MFFGPVGFCHPLILTCFIIPLDFLTDLSAGSTFYIPRAALDLFSYFVLLISVGFSVGRKVNTSVWSAILKQSVSALGLHMVSPFFCIVDIMAKNIF